SVPLPLVEVSASPTGAVRKGAAVPLGGAREAPQRLERLARTGPRTIRARALPDATGAALVGPRRIRNRGKLGLPGPHGGPVSLPLQGTLVLRRGEAVPGEERAPGTAPAPGRENAPGPRPGGSRLPVPSSRSRPGRPTPAQWP